MSYYTNRRYNPPAEVYAASTLIGPLTGGGQAPAPAEHAGYKATRRTDGDLAQRIEQRLAELEAVPLGKRDDHWAVAVGGARFAQDLLAQGRRAKAGVVLAKATFNTH